MTGSWLLFRVLSRWEKGSTWWVNRFTATSPLNMSLLTLYPVAISNPAPLLFSFSCLWRLQLLELWFASVTVVIEQQTGSHWLKVTHYLFWKFLSILIEQTKKNYLLGQTKDMFFICASLDAAPCYFLLPLAENYYFLLL